MRTAEDIRVQIKKLALAQYLIWQRELPAGFNKNAIELSFCYHLLRIPFNKKISRFSLGVMRALISRLTKTYDLPADIESLKQFEKTFRLTIEDKQFTVSDCEGVNYELKKANSKLRLLSGFYGAQRFFVLGEAEVKQVKDFTVYRFKSEDAITPGAHLLMAAMVQKKNIFLRENSARFLFYQKWRPLFRQDQQKDKLSHKLKQQTLSAFGIKSAGDFKGKSKFLISAFMELLFQHEINHDSMAFHLKDPELAAIAGASAVLNENILTHLNEIFADWMPSPDFESPLKKIFDTKDSRRLLLYITDNWFYDTGFPNMEIFTSLDLAPLFFYFKHGSFNRHGLLSEVLKGKPGPVMALYEKFVRLTASELKEIVEKSEFILNERPVNFRTISLYTEDKIRSNNQGIGQDDYLSTFWSNIFQYLLKFSKDGHKKAENCLWRAEQNLKRELLLLLKTAAFDIKSFIAPKAEELAGQHGKCF